LSTFQNRITLPTAQERCIFWAWWRDWVFAVLVNKHKHNNNAASYNCLGPEYQTVHRRLLYYPGTVPRG